MKSFYPHILFILSTIYLPSQKEIEKKVNENISNNQKPYIQLVEYRKLEKIYSIFYMDQLSAEITNVIDDLWKNKSKLLKNVNAKEITKFLNEAKSICNLNLFYLHKRRLSLYKNFTYQPINKSFYVQLLNNNIQISYYKSLIKGIDQLFHRFISILYV